MIVAKALAVWALILLLAILNGITREALLTPAFGQVPGLLISGLLLCALILLVTYLTLPWLSVAVREQQLRLGIFWLLLTLVFEFAFGLAQGKPLSVILSAYTFRGGNLWPLVLCVTAVAPRLMARVRGWR